MTKQQAINILNGLEQCLDDYCELNDEGKAAFRMAITALELFGNSEQLSSAQPDATDINVGTTIYRQAAIDAMCGACSDWCDEGVCKKVSAIQKLPSAQPEWNNHTVACLLAELFDDPCACNYNGIDEWLPQKCEVIDSCPNPVGVACWEQYLKHRAERRTDEGSN